MIKATCPVCRQRREGGRRVREMERKKERERERRKVREGERAGNRQEKESMLNRKPRRGATSRRGQAVWRSKRAGQLSLQRREVACFPRLAGERGREGDRWRARQREREREIYGSVR